MNSSLPCEPVYFAQRLTHADAYRSAIVRVAGNARQKTTVTAIPAAIQPNRRWRLRPPSRCSWIRAKPRIAFGRHCSSGCSEPRRSLTHWFRFVSLFFSISLDVLPPEHLLCTAQQGSNGCGMDIKSRSQFLVCQPFITQQQQLRVSRTDNAQNQTNLLLGLVCGPDFLRGWRPVRFVNGQETDEAFITRTACDAS